MKVKALELGYDNVTLRQPGDEFEMPDDVFEPRPRLDAVGAVVPGAFYEPPHWFEPVDTKLKAKVEEERKAIRKRNVAAVAAVDPAKQAAAYLASLEELRAEVEALKKAQALAEKALAEKK